MAQSADITVSEAAAILDEPYYHVHRLIRKKILKKRKKIGWFWVLNRTEVVALRDARKKKSK